jgi:hypothetical protein
VTSVGEELGVWVGASGRPEGENDGVRVGPLGALVGDNVGDPGKTRSSNNEATNVE